MADAEAEKRLVAESGAALAESGMTVGLGTGTTVAHLLPALARRELDIRCVATSPATFVAAHALGLDVHPFSGIDRLDLAIDGADQVDPSGWLVKGGGGAHTREKVVAAASERFVVIVSSDKLVTALAPPVPLELLPFGVEAVLRALGDARSRGGAPTPDNGVLADWWGPIGDPAALARWLSSTPGVVDHGLFAPSLVSQVLVGIGDEVEVRDVTSASATPPRTPTDPRSRPDHRRPS
jgi:ribose 5-phosphate isomerase A